VILLVALAPAAMADYSPVTKATWVPDGGVHAVAVAGPYLYLGGLFTSLKNASTGQVVTRTRLARITVSTGELDMTWAPTASDDIRALAVSEDGTRLFLGGYFGSVSGVTRTRLAAVSTSGAGALVTSWVASANGTVRAMFVKSGLLYVAGVFTGLDGATRTYAGAVTEATGGLDPNFRPAIGAYTFAAMPSPDGATVLIGGEFLAVGGQARNYIASVDAVTGAVSGWNPAPGCGTSDPNNPCYVLDLVPKGSSVYTAIAGPGGRVVAYNASTGAVRWKVYADGDVQTIAVDDKLVYAGGHFDPDFGGTTRTMLAAVDQTTGVVDPAFAPVLHTAYPGVEDLATTPDFLVAAGDFTNASGTGQAKFAIYPVIGTPDTTAPSAPTGLAASGVTSGSVTLSWNAATDNVGVTGYQVVRNGTVLPTTVSALTYTDSGLSASTQYTYTVRAVDAAGNTSVDSSPVSVTTSAPSSVLFSDSWTGSDGAPWGTAWTTSNASGTVDIQSNAGRLAFNDVSGAYARAQLSGVTAAADSEVVTSYAWSSNTARTYTDVFLRGSGGWRNAYRPTSGYGVELQSDSRTVLLMKTVNGTTTTLQSVSAQQLTTGKQWLRLRVSGSTVQFKIWSDGQSEPAGWAATATDTSVTTSGQLFVSEVRSSSNVGAKAISLDDLSLNDVR
jgi:chitodextrinase